MKQKEQSQRQQKVSNLIKLSLNKILKRGKLIDSKLIGDDVIVTNVKISPDLKTAKCYFILYPMSKFSKEEIIDSFDISLKSIRKQVTESINLRYSPELRFYFDSGYENLVQINQILSKVNYSTEE